MSKIICFDCNSPLTLYRHILLVLTRHQRNVKKWSLAGSASVCLKAIIMIILAAIADCTAVGNWIQTRKDKSSILCHYKFRKYV